MTSVTRPFALRLLLVVGLTVAVVLTGSLWWTWQHERRQLESALAARAQQTADVAQLLVQRRLERGRTLLRAVAASRAVAEALAARNENALLAAIQPFRDEFGATLIVIDGPDGRAMAWSTPLAMLALGGKLEDVPAHVTTTAGDLSIPFDAAVLSEQGETLGTVHAAVLLGRLFVRQTSTDLGLPVALVAGGRVMHHNFPGGPPPPPDPTAAETEAPPLQIGEFGGESFDIAYRRISGLPEHQAPTLVAVGLSRRELTAARQRYLLLLGLVGGAGLVLVLGAVGGFLRLAESQEQLARQRDAEARRSEGLSDRLSHLTAVVHDIKAPVAGIQLRCEGLLDGDLEAPAKAALAQVIDACERIGLYLTNVLTAAQVEEGPIKPQRSVVLVPGLLDEVRERLAPLAARRGVQLSCTADPQLPPLSADQTFLERALLNLGSNAIGATPHGGRVELFARRDARGLALGVTDTGPGFRDFDPATAFSRERPRVKDQSLRTGGTGLGLYIVARIAEAHGGTVEAQNRPEGGAQVTLVLPL